MAEPVFEPHHASVSRAICRARNRACSLSTWPDKVTTPEWVSTSMSRPLHALVAKNFAWIFAVTHAWLSLFAA